MDGNRIIETQEAREQIAELKRVKEELEDLVRSLETHFLGEFSQAYDSAKAEELKNDIAAMKLELEGINKEVGVITEVSEKYIESNESTDMN